MTTGDRLLEDRVGSVAVVRGPAPVEVVPDGGADERVRSGRARIAKLSLELRAARHEAEAAERAALHHTADGQAREHLRATLESRLARRRAEMAAEVDHARSVAARHVIAAQAEAAELLVAADRELWGLRVAPDDSEALAAARREVLRRVADIGAATPSPSPWSAAGPGPSPEPASAMAPPVAAGVPVVVPAPTPVRRAPAPRRSGSFRARLLHLDVLLPLAAGFSVFVLLLTLLR